MAAVKYQHNLVVLIVFATDFKLRRSVEVTHLITINCLVNLVDPFGKACVRGRILAMICIL